ncbi:MAG TPA: GNAT family N-acetyltransferase [Acidimicrobiales bacterium]|nr:GNAT family N-acetyltransferase [Acidimicrobiales bacterium]
MRRPGSLRNGSTPDDPAPGKPGIWSGYSDPRTFETGIWLARHERGEGYGRRAVAVVLERAAAAGADEVVAETTSANKAAQGLLRSLGFGLAATEDGKVRGRISPGELRTSSPSGSK